MPLLTKTLVRTLALAVIYLLALVIIDRSDTTDPLGAGLLLFLVFVVVSLVWGAVDGTRAAGQALLVWLLTAVLSGVLITVESVFLLDDVSGDAGDFGGTVLLTLVLVLPAALVGIGVGALIGRARD